MNLNRSTVVCTAALFLLSVCSGCASGSVRDVYAPKVEVGYKTEASAADLAPEETEEKAPETDSTVYFEEPTAPAAMLSAETVQASEEAQTAEPAATEEAETAETAEIPPAEETAEAEYIEYEPFYETGEAIDSYYMYDYGAYNITAADREFTKHSVFVGDSICKGFSEFKVVGSKRVYARGNLGARSFFDYNFYYGEEQEEISYSEVLSRTAPEFVFLSMGMNDINMTNEEQFCENYSKIIDLTLAESGAAVYLCAITPVDSEFTTNYRVDCFNLKLKLYIEENYPERVYFVDFGKHLRDEEGKLREIFTSGDGIHLSPYAYYIALWEMNRTTKADGLR